MKLELLMSAVEKPAASVELRTRAKQVASDLSSSDTTPEGLDRIRALRVFAEQDGIHVDDAFWLADHLLRNDNQKDRELARECVGQIFPSFALDVLTKVVRYPESLRAPDAPEVRQAEEAIRSIANSKKDDLESLFCSSAMLDLLERIASYFRNHVLRLVCEDKQPRFSRLIGNISTSVRIIRLLYK